MRSELAELEYRSGAARIARLPGALRFLTTLFVAALALLLAASVDAQEPGASFDEDFFAQVDGHVAALSDTPYEQLVSGGLGYSARVGWRWARWGAFIEGGQAAWFQTGLDRAFDPGVLNVGIGGEYRFHSDRVRTSLSGGTSTLLFDTILDNTGTTGWYLNVRPAGLRWGLNDWMALQFDPLSFEVMQPVTRDERITKLEYQTVLALEFQ